MPNREYKHFVYVMASLSGTLYTGYTNNVYRRSWEHQLGEGSEFTKKYGCERLLWYEQFRYADVAIAREKEIKKWRRGKKVALIQAMNPSWRDLSRDFYRQFAPDPSNRKQLPGTNRDSSAQTQGPRNDKAGVAEERKFPSVK